MYEKKVGSKYEATKDLDMREVTKLIREDIKQAIKSGKLPAGLQTGVKLDRYSMGRSVTVTVKKCPFIVHNTTGSGVRFSEEAYDLLKALRDIVNAYNYDHSEPQSDYFDVHFYEHIDFDYELLETQRAELNMKAAVGKVVPFRTDMTEQEACLRAAGFIQ